MNIDKSKLINLLVEKTSLGREEIEVQLDQLIERILDAAKRGKALEIKEFGMFYFDEEGELRFDPSQELSTEISFKYAGMKPVELKPERDTSISKAEEQAIEWDEDEDQEFESSSEKIEDEEDDKEDEELYDPFAPEPVETEETVEEVEEEEPIARTARPISRRPVRRRNNYAGLLILLIILLIAALIVGYFYYTGAFTQNVADGVGTTIQTDPRQDENDDILAATQATDAVTEGGAETGLAQAESAGGTQPSGQQEESAGNDDIVSAIQTTDAESDAETEPGQAGITGEVQAAGQQQGLSEVSEEEIETGSNAGLTVSEAGQSLFGLTGPAIIETEPYYSIVLHSFLEEERANSAAGSLREEGYRVFVNTRIINENMVWRVSVGQFETLGDAQQAAAQLQDPFNTQNFIQRLQTN